ncbi:MAG TPA: NAD(P)/FAD-dependent oxidoreductase [Blastocatellia bacterium]|nr:NAD(P)/FAD-dependent oxidoreductase [Blastocatellia bacterium]
MSEFMQTDVIILGGGAAGLFCASIAAKRGRKVVVLERAEKVGKKILISGGGRCNFTNLHTKPENFLSQNPNFAKSALARFTPQDFIALVKRYDIAFHEKKLGQLFCDGSAQQIVAMLLAECAGVTIKTHCEVKSVAKDQVFRVQTNQGEFLAPALVIATGGVSIPKMGATDFGYRVAQQFGLKVIAPKPALVPLTLAPADLQTFRALSGVSVDALVSLGKQKFRENILFTHRGLSGPAILQISSYWNAGQTIRLNLLPELNGEELLLSQQSSALTFPNWLSEFLPQRFAKAWAILQRADKPLRQFSGKELRWVAETLHQWELKPNGTEGFAKAEVTSGGVDTTALSSKTMEANQVPGLYFIGEVVDVTGHLGGYNFQWAWASAHAAGQFV